MQAEADKTGKKSRMVRHWHNNGNPIKFETQIERNDLCPCGSGKKYKRCRMQNYACQQCKTCGQTMKLYQRRADGSLVFACEDCMKKAQEGTQK